MSFAVHCPECGSGLEVEEEHRDWTVRCPNCRHEFRPSGVSPAAAPAPPGTYAVQHDEPPDDEPRPKRRRRRREEDDDEDDYEYDDRANALRLVSGPATAIKVVAWLGIGLKILSVLLSVVVLAMMMGKPPAQNQNQNNGPFANNNAFGANDEEEAVTNLVIAGIEALVHVVVGVLMLIGAGKMSRLESHGWAQAAAILGMIPCISPCCLLGLPFGIWALNTINRPDVRRAFREARRYD